jgi:serine/threonine protein kinase
MLGVSDVTAIQFEENDGTEIAFTDLFEYRTSIGVGGFGFVVAALDKATGEEVALKLLFKDNASSKVIELFKKEASLIELFDHPNIVKFRFLKNFSNYL